MLKRLLYSLALLLTVALLPQLPTMVLALGKPATFAVLAPVAFTLVVAGTANVLGKADQ
jgi:hypothetical protein